jgi:hypothetical protein
MFHLRNSTPTSGTRLNATRRTIDALEDVARTSWTVRSITDVMMAARATGRLQWRRNTTPLDWATTRRRPRTRGCLPEDPHMRQITLAALAGLVVVLWGCGAAATPIPASGTVASTAPSAAASTVASTGASAEASTAVPSADASVVAPSSAGGSFAIPSFVLPSGAKDLEALLPNTVCGSQALKASMTGDQFMTQGDPEFQRVLTALGKQPSDVAFAIAGSPTGCVAGIFRIKGVDASLIEAAFIGEEQKQGKTFTKSTVAGKSVYAEAAGGAGVMYIYFASDAAIFVQAKDATQGAEILQQLP